MAFAIHTIDKPDALFARLANYDGRTGAFCRTHIRRSLLDASPPRPDEQ